MSALAVTFMAVPQGVAYAVIAVFAAGHGFVCGFYPMHCGWFDAEFQTRHHWSDQRIVTVSSGRCGRDDASRSFECWGDFSAHGGVMQFSAGVLRLGAFVDYISNPVVLGYITGAGLLIGIGQLPNVTGTIGGQGWLGASLWTWVQGLGGTETLTLIMALSTTGGILIIRKINRRLPQRHYHLGIGHHCLLAFWISRPRFKTIADLAPIPQGLPPLTLPDLSLLRVLLPVAFACTVLSLVESSAVARSVAADTRQRLQLSVEFTGQGLANIAAGLFGGYPTSGSLARTAINHQSGHKRARAALWLAS